MILCFVRIRFFPQAGAVVEDEALAEIVDILAVDLHAAAVPLQGHPGKQAGGDVPGIAAEALRPEAPGEGGEHTKIMIVKDQSGGVQQKNAADTAKDAIPHA